MTEHRVTCRPMIRDYTAVEVAHVQAAADRAIEDAQQLVEGIVSVEGERIFENTIWALDETTARLIEGYGEGPFLARVHVDPDVRRAASEAEERLTKWQVELVFRRDLYQALKEYSESAESAGLEGEHRRLFEHWMRDFKRAGHELPEADRVEVERLRNRLVELEVKFQRNIDEYEDGLDLTREELEGLPDSFIEGLREGSRPGTYRVSLDYPELHPFMDQARRRDLREQLQSKAWNAAVEANRPLLEEALELRRRIAELLGYPSWAHYAMEVKMARSPDRVREFYDELLPGLTGKSQPELADLREALEAETGDSEPASWDWRYYDTQIRRDRFGIDPNEVAEYFPLEDVFSGMLELTAEVFGVEYRRIDQTLAWHEDVMLFEIRDPDQRAHVAYFYADLFPREGKYGHAAAFPLVPAGRQRDGSYRRPVCAIVANFTKPQGDRPSLLRHDEVVTLFHEFGHILHMALTTAEFARFAGAETEWDFVEAPSQIMEHWTWHPDVLQRFARHYRSGEPIPRRLVDRLVEARDLNVGLRNLRQAYFGLLDLSFHDEAQERDMDALNREAYRITGFPFHEGTFFPASFGHLMGGYDAGYYGYLWSKVYGDDMFSRFEGEGVTSQEVGRDYRHTILERGGSVPADQLLKDFLGREPSKTAFFRYMGLEDDAMEEVR